MIDLSRVEKYYVACGYTDMRRGIDGFAAIGERKVTGRVTVPHEQLEALFAMTPYYWKTPRGGAERLAALSQLETDISFRFLVFEKL